MHITYVKLKNGEEYSGPIGTFRPCFGWFTFLGEDRKFYFDECESVITPNERVSINSPIEGESCDEMERAAQDLAYGRARGWTQRDEWDNICAYPKEKFEWEKKYNCLDK